MKIFSKAVTVKTMEWGWHLKWIFENFHEGESVVHYDFEYGNEEGQKS